MIKINWDNLSLNINAIELLKNNQDKINWDNLSLNINAMNILKNNQDKINWLHISSNPSIFNYDYEKIRKLCDVYKEELIQKVFHPKRFERYLKEFNYDMCDL